MSRILPACLLAVALSCGASVSANAADTQVVHLVLFKWKPNTTTDQEKEAGAKLLELKGKIPGVISISFGHQNSPEAATKGHGFDAGLTVVFANAAARDAYLPNADHQAVVSALLKPIIADLAVMDYDLP
ncbi:MAG: Dabb family protein [Planctomycetes bacterium]|nr:Dabb family protein [Planctomycetota bacterium]